MENSKKYRNCSIDQLIEMALEDSKKSKNKKYYYKGKELSLYCRENNLDVRTIRSRVYKLIKDENYNNYSYEEIIEIAIKGIARSKTTYYYGGKSLYNYCREHKLNYQNILSCVRKAKNNEKYKGLSEEKIIDMVINGETKAYKYFYKGMTLYKYCKENNLLYEEVVNRLKYLKTRYDLSEEELIEMSLKLQNSFTRSSKYKYKGMDLKQYVLENGLSYNYVTYKIRNLKKLDENKNLSMDELIEKALNKKEYDNKYIYNGEPLQKYCKDNGLEYSKIVYKLKHLKSLDSYKPYSEEQLIYFVINDYKPSIYHYKGLPFNVYCKENNLDYLVILQRVYHLKRTGLHEEKTDNELIDFALSKEYFSNKETRYKGISLKEYCEINNLNVQSVKFRLQAIKKSIKFKDLTLDMMIEKAIEREIKAKEKKEIKGH